MAKLTGPALSLGAAGSVADTLTFSKWRGRAYVRQKVTPGNPNTAEQQLTRNAFSFLQAVFKVAPPILVAPWTAYATGKVLTDRNAFVKFNLPVLREEVDLDNWVASPGALGGLPPASATPTPGAGTLSIAIAAPTSTPTGWTLTAMQAAIILDQDPQTDTTYATQAGEDTTSTYAVAFSGLAAGDYQYRAWAKWTRPDGQFAYSPSIGGVSTVT